MTGSKPMLLSVVIPTLNRAKLLDETIRYVLREIAWLPQELQSEIEVIVADNASEDETPQLMEREFSSMVDYHRFPARAEIGNSLDRSATLGSGRYIWLFGDDDYCLPGTLRYIISALNLHADCVLFYLNRVVLDWQLTNVRSIAHGEWAAQREEVAPMREFIRRFTHWPGFLTCIIFRRQEYLANTSFEVASFDGWQFLARIYTASRNGKVWISYWPVIIQRLGQHSWKRHWPRYWMINMPRMLDALEKGDFTEGALNHWRQHEVTSYRVAVDSIVAKAFGIGARDAFWSEAAEWLTPLQRFSLRLVQILIPVTLAKTLYRMQPKYRATERS